LAGVASPINGRCQRCQPYEIRANGTIDQWIVVSGTWTVDTNGVKETSAAPERFVATFCPQTSTTSEHGAAGPVP
jgi:hypothetical protein